MCAKTVHLGLCKVRRRRPAVFAAITLLLGLAAAEETLRIGRTGNPPKFPGQVLFPIALTLNLQMIVVASLV